MDSVAENGDPRGCQGAAIERGPQLGKRRCDVPQIPVEDPRTGGVGSDDGRSYPKRSGDHREFGDPLLRLLAMVECGTRALLAAAFGPDNEGELGLASRLLGSLDATMLVLADAGFDAATFLNQVNGTGAAAGAGGGPSTAAGQGP